MRDLSLLGSILRIRCCFLQLSKITKKKRHISGMYWSVRYWLRHLMIERLLVSFVIVSKLFPMSVCQKQNSSGEMRAPYRAITEGCIARPQAPTKKPSENLCQNPVHSKRLDRLARWHFKSTVQQLEEINRITFIRNNEKIRFL